ncbi:MAG: SipW-dependent-type signal peptide-containing protein [Candidatus Pacebacteria bacterium]|nr:SipW-dependent-type signal peptide-containing protein [Candidatus Paceibacterota bacterium]
MNKKLIVSLSIIGVVAALAIGGTIAYFNDTETSTGNIFTAGSLDLKVDHLKQTYNDVNCNTCNLTLISDPTNMVVAKDGSSLAPYPAVYVGSNGGFIHPAWTAQNDPDLLAAGAKWIWESDPTRVEDLTNDVTYTFRKTFEWYGPIVSSDLWFAVGSDNSVEVWLNGIKVGENTGEYGYRQESMLHILGADVNDHVIQGENVLEFEVKNWALQGSTPYTNPAGLIYKFYISGNCQDNYFKQHCMLWGEKDLTTETFFNFDDVKPGDRGTNVISLHVYDNPAYACLIVNNKDDQENEILNPETKAGDTTDPEGELSKYINVFIWNDFDKDGVYEPTGETEVYSGSLADDPVKMRIADITGGTPLQSTTTAYLGLAWCAGTQAVDQQTGVITCDGSTMLDDAQSDSLSADLTAYVEQQRNNEGFECANVNLPEEPQDQE